ncbi:MAG: Amuc_1098 family type IV pilus outer membrane protein [Akkermansiaceae bacterium]
MEPVKPITFSRSRAALLAGACLISPLAAGEPRNSAESAGSEVARRAAAIEEARALLAAGDESYTAGRYEEAAVAYSGARRLLPVAPISADLRAAATERFAQASVEHARVLARAGDVAAAKAAVNQVLLPGVDPANPGALDFLAQLNDPIRTNPALTAEHARDVDAVRRALYSAEAAYNLGKFEEAISQYENVLRVDPTNAAARRGLEKVAAAKSNYGKAASDHTRAELLGQVDEAWELPLTPVETDPALTDGGHPGTDQPGGGSVSLRNKLARIIIPQLALDQASLGEALDLLRLRTSENDIFELDPSRKGVNFTLNLGAPGSPEALSISDIRFDLQLSNVPLSQVLKHLTEITRTTFTTDDYSVIIRPAGMGSVELLTRTYRVPPDFISSMSTGVQAGASADPFDAAPAGTGLLARRLGAQEALAAQGVAFPEGASASYNPSSSTLRVINTALNQDYITQLIETVTRTEPVMIALRVTMIRVQQSRLEELGFDWLLDNYGFGGDGGVPGTSKLNLSGGTSGNGSDLSDIELAPGATSRNPITGGNRSGDTAIPRNSIDDLINQNGGRQASNRAPGVFGLRGELDAAAVQMLMRGLNQKKGVDLMAQPATVTRSGQASSIAVSREFIYPTEYEPPELPNSVGSNTGIFPVTPATPTAFEMREVGMSLEVLPVADENKQFVNITLNPTFIDFDGFVNYGSPINASLSTVFGPQAVSITENAILMPIFSKQTLSTNVDVVDGGTLVLGGLMQERVENVEDKTPVFGSLPVVGRFFQSKARQNISTAVIFLVHVELMDPTGRLYRDR